MLWRRQSLSLAWVTNQMKVIKTMVGSKLISFTSFMCVAWRVTVHGIAESWIRLSDQITKNNNDTHFSDELTGRNYTLLAGGLDQREYLDLQEPKSHIIRSHRVDWEPVGFSSRGQRQLHWYLQTRGCRSPRSPTDTWLTTTEHLHWESSLFVTREPPSRCDA